MTLKIKKEKCHLFVKIILIIIYTLMKKKTNNINNNTFISINT